MSNVKWAGWRRAVAAFFLVAALPLPGQAALSFYDLVLTIDNVQANPSCAPSAPVRGFGCLELGQSFRGSFAVDSSILGTDGLNTTAPIHGFDLSFGALVYSTGSNNTALAGFRNPRIGAAAPGFVIQGGQVVDLYGGVYGFADVPFIDWYGVGQPRNRFSAYDGANAVSGSLVVMSAVPEPETYAMFALGVLMVGALKRARARRVRPDGA